MRNQRKLVVGVIKPFRLRAVIDAISKFDVRGVIHSEARGYGRQKDHIAEYHDDRYAVAWLPKIRIEFQVEPGDLARVIETFCDHARTGRQGDGKVWVIDAVTPESA